MVNLEGVANLGVWQIAGGVADYRRCGKGRGKSWGRGKLRGLTNCGRGKSGVCGRLQGAWQTAGGMAN